MTILKGKWVKIFFVIILIMLLLPMNFGQAEKMSLKAEVSKILDIFAREEMGNRLSQFSMIALKQMILEIIDQYEKQLEEGKTKKDKK